MLVAQKPFFKRQISVKIGGATFSADLGGSSFYSSVIDA